MRTSIGPYIVTVGLPVTIQAGTSWQSWLLQMPQLFKAVHLWKLVLEAPQQMP